MDAEFSLVFGVSVYSYIEKDKNQGVLYVVACF